MTVFSAQTEMSDTDRTVIGALKAEAWINPRLYVVLKMFVPLGFYKVEWRTSGNMAYGYKKIWDWMRGDYVESKIEWNMDDVEVREVDAVEPGEEDPQEDYVSVSLCSILPVPDGWRIR